MRFSTFFAASRSEKVKVSILPGTIACRLPLKLAISPTWRGGKASGNFQFDGRGVGLHERFDLGLAVVDGQRLAVFVDGGHVGHALFQAHRPQSRLPGDVDDQHQRAVGRIAEVAAGENADRLEAEWSAIAGPAAARQLTRTASDHVHGPLRAEGVDAQTGLIQHVVQCLPKRRLLSKSTFSRRVGRRLAHLSANVDDSVAALLLHGRQNLRERHFGTLDRH